MEMSPGGLATGLRAAHNGKYRPRKKSVGYSYIWSATGSVLMPLLFIIDINDLNTDITSKISKFADDTKLCHISIQSDLNKLVEWADKW